MRESSTPTPQLCHSEVGTVAASAADSAPRELERERAEQQKQRIAAAAQAQAEASLHAALEAANQEDGLR